MSYDYDLIVVGGGPGGYVAAVRAAELGLRCAIVENREFGGTCLNRGCIPTKTLLHAAQLYEECRHFDEIGLHADGVSFDYGRIHARKNEVVATLRGGIEQLIARHKVAAFTDTAVVADGHTVRLRDSGERLTGKYLLLATGSVPALPPIPGLDLPNVLNSDGLLAREDELPASLIIIGGGVIGVEFATVCAALGSTVTIIEAMDRLLPEMDKEISQNLTMLLKKRGITVHCGAKVDRVTEENGLTCHFTKKEQAEAVNAAAILVATGRRPFIGPLFEDGFTVACERGHIVVDENCRTNVESIYAIGDVTGGIQLAHYASAMGIYAVETMAGRRPSVDLATVPGCIYTSPEIAAVGLTEAQAKAAGIAVQCAKFPMSANGKSLVEQEERGFIKLVARAEDGVLIGAQLMCGRATDLVAELTCAITNGLTAEQLTAPIHPHPTFCEGIGEAAIKLKDALNK